MYKVNSVKKSELSNGVKIKNSLNKVAVLNKGEGAG